MKSFQGMLFFPFCLKKSFIFTRSEKLSGLVLALVRDSVFSFSASITQFNFFCFFCEFRSRLCQKLVFIGGTQTHLQKFCFVIIFIVFSLSDFHLCFSDRTETGIFKLGVLLELVIKSSNKSSSSLVTGIVWVYVQWPI